MFDGSRPPNHPRFLTRERKGSHPERMAALVSRGWPKSCAWLSAAPWIGTGSAMAAPSVSGFNHAARALRLPRPWASGGPGAGASRRPLTTSASRLRGGPGLAIGRCRHCDLTGAGPAARHHSVSGSAASRNSPRRGRLGPSCAKYPANAPARAGVLSGAWIRTRQHTGGGVRGNPAVQYVLHSVFQY